MTGASPADVQAAFCAVLVDEWARAGITDAVIAPGSRSTPLVLALHDDLRIRTHLVLDERAAGFVALGLGLATGRPGVVVTTSGTASVEIHPAVVEAHQAGVPLIAATTDRPPELHHVGAPQTVEQEGLFAGAVRWAAAPGVADLASASTWRSLASRAVAEAVGGPAGAGPVHLNLAFREPLIGNPSLVPHPTPRPGDAPWHSARRWPGAADDDVAGLLRSHAGGRGLMVVGEGAPPAGALLDAAAALGWPVLADPRSGCRRPHHCVVAAADPLLRIPEVAAWRPDIVVCVGAPWASKVLNQWLASLADATHVLIDAWGRWADPDRRAGLVVAGDASTLFDSLGGPARSSAWLAGWQAAEAAAQDALDGILGEKGDLAGSEPAVARSVVADAPAGARVVVSSSMPVRDVEWYAAPRGDVTVHSNRGANGIDGVVATSIGVALGGSPTVALLGDLAFLYDAGSLLWATGRNLALTLVVVDNDGGGIFSFLPQATALPPGTFEAFWGTPHGVDLAALAAVYGASVSTYDRAEALVDLLADATEPGLRVAVVRSDRAANVADHDLLNARVAEAVRGTLLH